MLISAASTAGSGSSGTSSGEGHVFSAEACDGASDGASRNSTCSSHCRAVAMSRTSGACNTGRWSGVSINAASAGSSGNSGASATGGVSSAASTCGTTGTSTNSAFSRSGTGRLPRRRALRRLQHHRHVRHIGERQDRRQFRHRRHLGNVREFGQLRRRQCVFRGVDRWPCRFVERLRVLAHRHGRCHLEPFGPLQYQRHVRHVGQRQDCRQLRNPLRSSGGPGRCVVLGHSPAPRHLRELGLLARLQCNRRVDELGCRRQRRRVRHFGQCRDFRQLRNLRSTPRAAATRYRPPAPGGVGTAGNSRERATPAAVPPTRTPRVESVDFRRGLEGCEAPVRRTDPRSPRATPARSASQPPRIQQVYKSASGSKLRRLQRQGQVRHVGQQPERVQFREFRWQRQLRQHRHLRQFRDVRCLVGWGRLGDFGGSPLASGAGASGAPCLIGAPARSAGASRCRRCISASRQAWGVAAGRSSIRQSTCPSSPCTISITSRSCSSAAGTGQLRSRATGPLSSSSPRAEGSM